MTVCTILKSKGKVSQNFVAFSEYMNFKRTWRGLQFEEALSSFFIELENCRLLCEKSFDQGWFPDFVSSIASNSISKTQYNHVQGLPLGFDTK